MSTRNDKDCLARLDKMIENFCSIHFLCSCIVMLFSVIFMVNNPEGEWFFASIYFVVFCIAFLNMMMIMSNK